MKSSLKEKITNYIPYNEQEEVDKKAFLFFLNSFTDVLTRRNLVGHFSASTFVVNKERTKMLMVYHKIYNGWVYPGGHADGEEDLLKVALREIKEESGLDVTILDENIFAIQAEGAQYHLKNNQGVSAHIHFDVIYLCEADETIPLKYKADESSGIKWVPFTEATGDDIVPFARPIHQKIIAKLLGDTK